MINKIIVTNLSGDTLELDLFHPELTGFAIKNITGLGPVKATVNVSDFSVIDGGVFNSARLPSRNIVFDIIFLPKPTIEATRIESYKFFAVKQEIGLEFETDSRHVNITGYVETNEPNIFSKDEGCQVSIICPDPYFYGIDAISYSLSSVLPNFEFPFSFELDEGTPLGTKIFSTISLDSIGNMYYDGTNEAGFILYMHAQRSVSGDLAVVNMETGESLSILGDKLSALTGAGITVGDSIYISTVSGNKYIMLVRNGVATNILNAFDRNSTWLKLRKGDNYFQFFWNGDPGDFQFYVIGNVMYEAI